MKRYILIVSMLFSCLTVHAEDTVDRLGSVYLNSEEGLEDIYNFYGLDQVFNKSLAIEVVSKTEKVHPVRRYLLQTYELSDGVNGTFKIHVRHPGKEVSSAPLPVVFVASGWLSDAATAELFRDYKDVIFVIYEYSAEKNDTFKVLKQLPEVLKRTPLHMALSLLWVSQQSWTNQEKLSTLGVSLGAIFLPLSQRVAQEVGVVVKGTALAYGGADVSHLVYKEIRGVMGEKETDIAMRILKPILQFLDTTQHLRSLQGEFLVIYGEEDKVIPVESINTLIENTPEPKKVVGIPGGHIGFDQWDIIGALGDEIEIWYSEIGLIDSQP